mmetsp:Transcript_26950/g.47688  ORF Transcript_26950/g.47688 Transcript_26950/m.47688 type:complete len:80 (+) Transcript_26950:798-1037(+)
MDTDPWSMRELRFIADPRRKAFLNFKKKWNPMKFFMILAMMEPLNAKTLNALMYTPNALMYMLVPPVLHKNNYKHAKTK